MEGTKISQTTSNVNSVCKFLHQPRPHERTMQTRLSTATATSRNAHSQFTKPIQKSCGRVTQYEAETSAQIPIKTLKIDYQTIHPLQKKAVRIKVFECPRSYENSSIYKLRPRYKLRQC